jgi:hypothetical protein
MAVLSGAVSEDFTARLIPLVASNACEGFTCKQIGERRGGEGLNPWTGLAVNRVGSASTSN